MRPRLPMGGIQLAASSSISKQLADAPCPPTSKCSRAGSGEMKKLAAKPNFDSSMPPPAPVIRSRNDHFHPLSIDEQHSLSNFDLFKMEDISVDDILIQSTEPMVFDDSLLLSLATEENSINSSLQHHDHNNHACSSHNHTHTDHRVHTAPVTHEATPNNNVEAHVLHRTVLLFPNDANLVHTALVSGPKQAILSPSPMPHNGYYYPLHMALCQGSNLPVLQILVQAGPQVLLQKDGPHGFTPLMLSLTHLPNRPDVHELLRKALPQAASIACDDTQELPLHVACRTANPKYVGLIQGLLQDHPAAVLQPNARGMTPLNIVALLPATAPHRTMVYQSLQYVARNLQSQQQNTNGGMGGGTGMGSLNNNNGLGALTAPC